MCNWLKDCERGGLLTGDLAEFWHLYDRHGAGNRSDPGNGTRDASRRGKALICGNDMFDPGLKLCNLIIQQVFQFGIHGFEHVSQSQLPMLLDLRQKPLSRLDKLSALGQQGSEKTYLCMWEVAPCIRSEIHELRNEFCIDPVRFRPRASAGRESLYLSWRQFPRRDPFCVKARPQMPFLPAGGFQADTGIL